MTAKPELRRVSAPLREQVIDILRADIVSSAIDPGTRLVEMALCSRFGVSRPVIREALRQLSAEGLVESVPNQGTMVATLTLEDARDLYEVRAQLEGLAGELFAQRASDADRTALQEAFGLIETSFAQDGLIDQLHGKDEFYDVLLRGAGNNVIRSTLIGIHARVQMLRAISMQSPGRLENSLAEIRQITDAAVAGNAIEARDACRTHIENAARIATATLAARLGEGR
jgi:DNA-binding GntR family transcriptional regulator